MVENKEYNEKSQDLLINNKIQNRKLAVKYL